MKSLPLGIIASASLALVCCETINQPITDTGFDPLIRPGSGVRKEAPSYAPELTPGSFVTATIPNTAFYSQKPKGNADADKLLKMGENMKIVSSESDYVKVELDSGEVGWIPSVMISAANPSPDSIPTDLTFPSYPPLPETGSIEPLPILDPAGLPPEGAIPTIIDPDAPLLPPSPPITIDPVPDLKPVAPEAGEEPKEKAEAAATDEAPAETAPSEDEAAEDAPEETDE